MTDLEKHLVDTERHRRTDEVNARAQQAIADARLMVDKLNHALNELDDNATPRKAPRAH